MDRNGVNNTFLMSSSTRLMERTVLEVSHIRDSLVKERNGWKEDLLIERENKKSLSVGTSKSGEKIIDVKKCAVKRAGYP
ncbi:uncharacterized [Tachysurus ichikawai]